MYILEFYIGSKLTQRLLRDPAVSDNPTFAELRAALARYDAEDAKQATENPQGEFENGN